VSKHWTAQFKDDLALILLIDVQTDELPGIDLD
jgi:hypothetical protein